jgi:homoserine O-acetyltransferase
VISFSSDWLFPPFQSRQIVDALLGLGKPVSYCNVTSTCGHDAFLLPDELPIYGEMVRGFLDERQKDEGRKMKADADSSSEDPTSIFHEHRLDYQTILDLIPTGSSVLDLGCGEGVLLDRLCRRGHGRVMGVELDQHQILASLRRGLDVVQGDLNHGLPAFAEDQFDVVVLSQTLQTILNVGRLLDDILRVGRLGIVSFPNIAYHKLRQTLAEQGRAPRSGPWVGETWHETPNVRFLSIADFEEYCRHRGIRIVRQIALDTERNCQVTENPNLNADVAIIVISR